jgi:hypothetical protein
MKKPSDRPMFIAKDASGNQKLVRAGRLEVPRELFPSESHRKGRDADVWRGSAEEHHAHQNTVQMGSHRS